jgi:ABC-type polysaccharide/polyol phosphate export permease
MKASLLARSTQDLLDGAKRWELASFWGMDDVRQRYARTLFGPFWLVIVAGVWIGCLGFVMSALLRSEMSSALPRLACGMILWIYFSSLLNEGADLVVSNQFNIQNTSLPFSVYIYRYAVRNFVIFLHYLPIIVGVIVFCRIPVSANTLLFLPGLALLTLSGVGLGVSIGFLVARYRDARQMLAALLQVLPLLTPIIWDDHFLPASKRWVAELNPLSHLISIVREPLIGQPVAGHSWLVAAAIVLVSLGIGFVSLTLYRKRCTFWL